MEKIESVFILEMPLVVEKWQEDLLNKRYETVRKIYNIILSKFHNRYKELAKTKQYREISSKLYDISARLEINKEIKEFKKVFPKTFKDKPEYLQLLETRDSIPTCTLTVEEKKEYKSLKNNLLSDLDFSPQYIFGIKDKGVGWKMAQYAKTKGVCPTIIAALCQQNLWRAISSMVFYGKKNTYKRFGELSTVYGKKSNKVTLVGISFDGSNVIWRKSGKLDDNGTFTDLILPMARIPNEYEAQMLSNDIAYVGITRKKVRGQNKYYAQFTMNGIIPSKVNKETGKYRQVSDGKVGLDIGTSSLAIVSDNSLRIVELAEKAQPNQNKTRLLQRKIDRSVRVSNPNKFNEDGTIIKGNHDRWVFSNNCKKLKSNLREISRKLAAVRKNEHERLANIILSLGSDCYIEQMRWDALAKRSKNQELNNKGKMKRKKRFGKSIGNRAPATFINILTNKLKCYGKELHKINTQKCRASQYNQFTKEFIKKPLYKRWNTFPNGDKVQRDLYSAFLIQNTNDDLISFNDEQLAKKYQAFKQMHDIEMERVSNLPKKQLSSFGIG